ncbi:MAG: hypothetical protein OSB09_08775, partial [Planctomycetota bacterium]|nr:hypothetical protein [Planctomycetota bacterium]
RRAAPATTREKRIGASSYPKLKGNKITAQPIEEIAPKKLDTFTQLPVDPSGVTSTLMVLDVNHRQGMWFLTLISDENQHDQ